jgi:hypothetical protein
MDGRAIGQTDVEEMHVIAYVDLAPITAKLYQRHVAFAPHILT